MTCAHVVNVATTKIEGVASVDVSLNRALATVKLKPGNSVLHRVDFFSPHEDFPRLRWRGVY